MTELNDVPVDVVQEDVVETIDNVNYALDFFRSHVKSMITYMKKGDHRVVVSTVALDGYPDNQAYETIVFEYEGLPWGFGNGSDDRWTKNAKFDGYIWEDRDAFPMRLNKRVVDGLAKLGYEFCGFAWMTSGEFEAQRFS